MNEGVRLNSIRPWININKKGDFNRMHTHPGSDFAGVFWIKTPEKCGDIEFNSPYYNSQYNEFMSYNDMFQHSTGCVPSCAISPIAGKIFLFPSAIYHQVRRNDSNQDRISSSFNIKLS